MKSSIQIIKKAVEILKNNYSFRKTRYVPVENRQNYREYMVGIYNRFDEIGLIYSEIREWSFNKAVDDLGIKHYIRELKEFLELDSSKNNKKKVAGK